MKSENGKLKKYKLDELCKQNEIGIYGIPATAEEFSEEKIRYLRITDISDDGILLDDDKKSVSDDNIEKYILQEGDIVFARTGNSTGRAYLYDKKDGILAFAGFLIKYGLDKNKVNPKFLRYYTIGNTYKQWVKNLSVGSTRGNISAKTFAECPISLPDRKQQDLTVDVLSSLDDKIALNRRMNAKLEQMAKRLYDHWFVQFDFPNADGKPYKASGGKMVWNETLKRKIPAGWEVKKLGDVCNFRNGINYDKKKKGDKLYKIVNVRNISASSFFLNQEEFDEIWLKSTLADNYIVPESSILIARSGCPGATRIIVNVEDNVVFCGFIICMENFDSDYKLFFTYCLKALENTSATTTGGSILQNVSQETLKRIPVVIPPKRIISAFNEKTLSIFNYQLSIQKETQKLTALRDRLLPMFMNGQVEVR